MKYERDVSLDHLAERSSLSIMARTVIEKEERGIQLLRAVFKHKVSKN